MKLDRPGQAALLKLAQVDLEIEQIKNEISKAVGSKDLLEARDLFSTYAGEVISARTKFENLNMESRKADDNLHMVEERIARDLDRLNQTSSSKDAQAMQAEVESLTKRKAELEDVELEILERLEESQKELDEIVAKKESIAQTIAEMEATIQVQVDELKTRGRKLTADKEILVTKISTEILEKYKHLSAKQVAVGQVDSRACSACRMGLTSNTIDSLAALPEDEIGFCPECLAMIVR
jgi:predicted  nucleic acid-binding Zn-ribbon protein